MKDLFQMIADLYAGKCEAKLLREDVLELELSEDGTSRVVQATIVTFKPRMPAGYPPVDLVKVKVAGLPTVLVSPISSAVLAVILR